MALQSKQWRWLLGLVGALIVLGSALSAGYLVQALAREERDKVQQWFQAQDAIQNLSDEAAAICDLTLHSQILESNVTIPLILVDDQDRVIGGRNFGESRDQDTAYLGKIVRELVAEGIMPLGYGDTRIYYLESKLLRNLRFFPFIQMGLILLFVVLGYLAISAARRSEQNRVWIGMAKETAHQLGTPISAIMAWVELLRAEYAEQPSLVAVADELNRDADRLQLVADRFNKIGSQPELQPVALAEVLQDVYTYMRERTPRKVDFRLELAPELSTAEILINRHLFEWVLENLIRNALDAMEGSGHLVLRARPDGKLVQIEVEDSGKGIPASKFKTIFQPGYTTKARGWGLGLSLAMRIVKDYHKGKIFVKESQVGKGSTFAIRLPLKGH